MTELRSVADFNAAREQGARIYITDSANGDKVHASTCRHLKEENFVQKVITKANRNGRYHALDSGEAIPPGATRCPVCQP